MSAPPLDATQSFHSLLANAIGGDRSSLPRGSENLMGQLHDSYGCNVPDCDCYLFKAKRKDHETGEGGSASRLEELSGRCDAAGKEGRAPDGRSSERGHMTIRCDAGPHVPVNREKWVGAGAKRSSHVCTCPPVGLTDEMDTKEELLALRNQMEDENARPEIVPTHQHTAEKLVQAAQAEGRLPQNTGQVQKSVIFNKHFSSANLNSLQPIKLKEMKLRRRHVGRYLLCRIITPANKRADLSFGIMDSDGTAEVVALYDTPYGPPSPTSQADLSVLYPIGSCLIIKEPAYKVAFGGESVGVIRVYSWTDIVWTRDEKHVKTFEKAMVKLPSVAKEVDRLSAITPEGWKTAGNDLMAKGQLYAAEKSYSQGLALDPSHILLLLNRAAVRLKLNHHLGALIDANTARKNLDAVGQFSPTLLEKVLFRIGRACYALQAWTDAEHAFIAYQTAFPSSQPAKDWQEKSVERDDDREGGIYDWYEIYKASRKDPRVDIGDYLGSVEIAQDAEEVFVEESAAQEKTKGKKADKTAKKRGRGRYLRANKPVRQGELLMVVKPYACVYASDLEQDNSIFAVNLRDLAVESATQTATAQAVISRALDQPHTYDLLNHLYAGPDYPQPEVLPAADLISSPAIDLPTLMTMQQPIIDPSKVDKWISYNSFVAERLGPALKPSPDAGPEHSSRINPSYPKSKPSALYLLPSLANHACVPSARWVCYGDAFVLRAAYDLNKGDEISISYTGDRSLSDRASLLAKHTSLCTCLLCNEERLDSLVCQNLRSDLLASLEDIRKKGTHQPPSPRSLKASREMVEKMERTYDGKRSKGLRVEMWEVYHHLADQLSGIAFRSTYINRNFALESIDKEIAALESCGCLVSSTGLGTRNPESGILAQSTSPATDLLSGNGHAVVDSQKTADVPTVATAQKFLCSTPLVRAEACVGSCLAIASVWLQLGNEKKCKGWVESAVWADNVAVGGGEAVFRTRWQDTLEMYGLDEDEWFELWSESEEEDEDDDADDEDERR